MNRVVLIPTLAVAVLAGCVAPVAKTTPQHFKATVMCYAHLGLWNITDKPVAVSVFIDGKKVFESVLAVATIAPPLDEISGGTFVLDVGTHSILIEDQTRSTRKQFEFTLKQESDIYIFVNRDGIRLDVYDTARAVF